MYNNVGSVVAGSSLAMTGTAAQSVWMILGAFALISAGVALNRVAPRVQA